MNKIIKNVLLKIENNGFEAYIIGGYVRDLLVGIPSYDIDICTNATPRDLLSIFPNSSSKNLGGIDFKIKEYHFEITTYRKEIKYKNRKPIEYDYVDSLIEDLNRRDFTINAICMNSKGEIIDLLNGTKDITSGKISLIGDAKTKIKEDPLRILRAVRIATILDFNLEPNLYKEIKANYQEVSKLSTTRMKEELDKILLSNHVKKGLQLLEDLNLTKILEIENYDEIVPVKNIEGMYAQINIKKNLPFTRVEKENIENIKKIIKEDKIEPMTLYRYGLYLCLLSAEILNIDKKKIIKMEKELAIHDKKDINITAEDLIDLDIPKVKINKVMKELEIAIINKYIRNKKGDIIKYINIKRKGWI